MEDILVLVGFFKAFNLLIRIKNLQDGDKLYDVSHIFFFYLKSHLLKKFWPGMLFSNIHHGKQHGGLRKLNTSHI